MKIIDFELKIYNVFLPIIFSFIDFDLTVDSLLSYPFSPNLS